MPLPRKNILGKCGQRRHAIAKGPVLGGEFKVRMRGSLIYVTDAVEVGDDVPTSEMIQMLDISGFTDSERRREVDLVKEPLRVMANQASITLLRGDD